jgi:hypothetical protein
MEEQEMRQEMRKDIFESEEEYADVMGRSIVYSEKCFDDEVINFAESIKEAKRLGVIKQSPLEKLKYEWDVFYQRKYSHGLVNTGFPRTIESNDQWAKAATDVINAQKKVIEYLKQKLEEQK